MIPHLIHAITPSRQLLSIRSAALFLVALPALTSCVSESQMRMAVEDRDREIATLRSDKTELQERLDLLSYERDDLRMQLSSAESRVQNPMVQEASAAVTPNQEFVAFPELEELGITTGQRGVDTVISVPAEVTFGSGKATVSTGGRGALQKVAARLKSDFDGGARFFIEGHTDSDPIRKSKFASNRELSIARAMAVLEFLVTEGKVPDRRFVVVGHGQYDPIASNDKSGKAKNRRVEIVVKNPK
ncbi:MAG: flagellar motor protein MotB [Planctomycetota bacterium]|jgi:flagellar motor protein MotB